MGQSMVVPGKAAAQQWRSIVYVCAVFGVVTLYVFSMELKRRNKEDDCQENSRCLPHSSSLVPPGQFLDLLTAPTDVTS